MSKRWNWVPKVPCGHGPFRVSHPRRHHTLAKPTPRSFKPYGVGYVELPGQLKVESRLTIADPTALKNGMAMELVGEVIGKDEEGNDLVTFAFAPA